MKDNSNIAAKIKAADLLANKWLDRFEAAIKARKMGIAQKCLVKAICFVGLKERLLNV